MSTGPPDWVRREGFDVRDGCGAAGIVSLGEGAEALVLVDVLRFTTGVDVATAAGATVDPSRFGLRAAGTPNPDGRTRSAPGRSLPARQRRETVLTEDVERASQANVISCVPAIGEDGASRAT
jgi:hypothetical protein